MPTKIKDGVASTPKAEVMQNIYHDVSRFRDEDIYLFKEGNHFRLYDKLGSHEMRRGDVAGVYFAVWAPNAEWVSVIGDFNGWNNQTHKLGVRWDSSGIWEGFIPNLTQGAVYKFHIASRNGHHAEKADPFAFFSEVPPKTAS
jgi:1,4-alpha-glucan branching enzyme